MPIFQVEHTRIIVSLQRNDTLTSHSCQILVHGTIDPNFFFDKVAFRVELYRFF